MPTDERHHCLHSLYEVSISEAQVPGHLVTSLSVVDPDLPPSSLEYHLSGNGADKFAVNEAGEIRLVQYLDRETNSGILAQSRLKPNTVFFLFTYCLGILFFLFQSLFYIVFSFEKKSYYEKLLTFSFEHQKTFIVNLR